jgi:hypothetical protein
MEGRSMSGPDINDFSAQYGADATRRKLDRESTTRVKASDEAWSEVLKYYRLGKWLDENGPPPGHPGCRVPRHLLRIRPGPAVWRGEECDLPIEVLDEVPVIGSNGWLYQGVIFEGKNIYAKWSEIEIVDPKPQPSNGGGGINSNGPASTDPFPGPQPQPQPQDKSSPHNVEAETDSDDLREVVMVFDKWLMLQSHIPIYVVLGTVAANLLPGDPVWLGIIAPPSSAKTEILNSAAKLSFVKSVATLTQPALLSGTPKRQRTKGAKGGLLAAIGAFGIIIMKDFGSILSMRPDAKAEILAALREIFDGRWSRDVGTDGGMTLEWTGKCGFVFGSTEAYDEHHGVIGSLGDRFLLSRMMSSSDGQIEKALDHTGEVTKIMRDELAAAVNKLFDKTLVEPEHMSKAEIKRLKNVVSLAVHLRGYVSRDRYRRDIEYIHGAEGPGRLAISLERLFAGLVAIGVRREYAMRIIEGVALDSTPPKRRHAFELLDDKPSPTRDIAKAMRLPTTTVRRALEELEAHHLAVRSRPKNEFGEEMQGGADLWALDPEWTSWKTSWKATLQ